jgi:hypothetical protein
VAGLRLIFASEVGTPMDPDNFSHSFARLCERAGLGHWHPHEPRHSGASLMLAQGTPLHVVSEVLGHASIAITKDVYGHLLEGDKRAAAQSMSRALFVADMCAWLPAWLPKRQESPLPGGQRACELGALGGTRTPNLLIRSQMLYPLSYERSHCSILHSRRSVRVPTVLPTDHRHVNPGRPASIMMEHPARSGT